LPNQDTISKRIRETRRQLGLSQAQLARPELSDSYISLIESGSRTPTPSVLKLIATKLGCSVDYLLHGVATDQVTEIRNGIETARSLLEKGAREAAREQYEKMLSNPNIARMPELRAEGEYGLALATEACGRLDDAIGILVGLRERQADTLTDELRIASALALSRCYRDRGDVEAAIDVAEQEIARMGETGWTDHLIELGSTLLSSYYGRGDLLRAQQLAAELLAAAEKLGTPRAIIAANWNAAHLAEAIGQFEEALTLIDRAWAERSNYDDLRNKARLRVAYAQLRLRIRPDEAEECRGQLLKAEHELRETAASSLDLADCLLSLARAEVELGNAEQAVDYGRKALEANAGASSELQAEIEVLRGQAYLMLGRIQEATAAIESAMDVLAGEPQNKMTAETWLGVAAVLQGTGDNEGSKLAYQRAMECSGV
jgi:transcriptional regulator with XRE-family HTH domain/predicted negative regulator of RcsB-dependent stress response